MNDHTQVPMTTVSLTLPVFGRSLRLKVGVPDRPVSAAAMLGVWRMLEQVLSECTLKALKDSGQGVSCRERCGHCCRKLIPVSAIEAWSLSAWMGKLPSDTRAQVVDRFLLAEEQMRSIGLGHLADDPFSVSQEEFLELGAACFREGIACPFLEKENCLIYDERPLSCREYRVASPPSNCARDAASTSVSVVVVPYSVAFAVARLHLDAPDAERNAWIPLAAARSWASVHPPPAPRRGLEWLQRLIALLERQV